MPRSPRCPRPSAVAHRIRWGWLGIMIGGTLVLIPWTVYLAFALPDDYVVHDWTATWGGFDLLLIALMTVVFGMLRRQSSRAPRCRGCHCCPGPSSVSPSCHSSGPLPEGPWANSFRNPSSSRTGTPSSMALSYFDPGESPATT
jgi:hypothetical protein